MFRGGFVWQATVRDTSGVPRRRFVCAATVAKHISARRARAAPGSIQSGYDVLRVLAAVVLLIAAGLKAYQLATEPVLGTGFSIPAGY